MSTPFKQKIKYNKNQKKTYAKNKINKRHNVQYTNLFINYLSKQKTKTKTKQNKSKGAFSKHSIRNNHFW